MQRERKYNPKKNTHRFGRQKTNKQTSHSNKEQEPEGRVSHVAQSSSARTNTHARTHTCTIKTNQPLAGSGAGAGKGPRSTHPLTTTRGCCSGGHRKWVGLSGGERGGRVGTQDVATQEAQRQKKKKKKIPSLQNCRIGSRDPGQDTSTSTSPIQTPLFFVQALRDVTKG